MTKNAYPFQYVVNKILFVMNIRSKLKFKTMLSKFAGVLKSPFVFKIEFWICLHTVLIEIIKIPTVTKPNSMKPLWKMSLTTMWKSRMASSSTIMPGHIFWNTKEYILPHITNFESNKSKKSMRKGLSSSLYSHLWDPPIRPSKWAHAFPKIPIEDLRPESSKIAYVQVNCWPTPSVQGAHHKRLVQNNSGAEIILDWLQTFPNAYECKSD